MPPARADLQCLPACLCCAEIGPAQLQATGKETFPAPKCSRVSLAALVRVERSRGLKTHLPALLWATLHWKVQHRQVQQTNTNECTNNSPILKTSGQISHHPILPAPWSPVKSVYMAGLHHFFLDSGSSGSFSSPTNSWNSFSDIVSCLDWPPSSSNSIPVMSFSHWPSANIMNST